MQLASRILPCCNIVTAGGASIIKRTILCTTDSFLYNAFMEVQKKHIICISGKPGSGKSTASKSVAKYLEYDHFSSGDLFRAVSAERGASDIHHANKLAEGDDTVDKLVDQKLRDMGVTQDNLAIDSRMAWHWMPNAYKVYLDLDVSVAARRIIANTDPVRLKHEHIPSDPDEYAAILQGRLNSEILRYGTQYNVNPYDTSNYDLVVDTEINTPQQVTKLIVDGYQQWLQADAA